uniref:Enhancer of mRNA-decapping protein 3 n=1 Tax=Bionectria ochroleuca TaxID=29856 RepID=A0A8H7KDV4_BIOOC
MLQSTAAFQPFTSLKRLSRGRKGNGDGNGWASEDVTEEMGEFDFENNLAKFDKRTIFDQMRKEDQIDEGDRLVSHNRRPKPGTNGGKNLHYTENVLDIPAAIAKNAGFWNSEADDPHAVNSGERNSGREPRASSLRRNESKRGVSRRSQSRKASQVVIGAQPLSRVNSAQRSNRPGLYIISSNRRLETISSLQMLNLENIAANEVGFTEDLMAENSGRGIAEVALRALADPAVKVRFEMAGCEASLDNSTTVILAGNNKSSVRAMAAARHLRNRNIDVVICIVGIERERDLLEDLRRQIDLYRAFGGR